MDARFGRYFRLIAAFPGGGCAVCRCLLEDGHRRVQALGAGEPPGASARRPWGRGASLCPGHVRLLHELAVDPRRVAAEQLGRAVHELRLLRDAVGAPPGGPPRWRGLVAWWRARRSAPWPGPATCPVCRHLARAEDRYLDAVVDFIGDPQFARAYAGSSGLCRPHLTRAVARSRGRRELGELVSRTLARWEEARQALARTPGPDASRDEAEASGWVRAVELLAGAPGLLDHGTRPRAARSRPTPADGRPRAAARGASEVPADVERGKLALRVQELTQQLNEVSSRAAALHYRLAQVAEDRNRLELNLNAERAANRLAMQTIDDLRAELARLRAVLAAPQARAPR